MVVPAGNQKLDGSAAAAYATYLAEGEPEQARLARFDDVLNAVVAGAARGPAAAVATALAGLGDGSTLDPGRHGAGRRGSRVLRAAAADGSLVSDVLPVNEIDTGATVHVLRLDAGQAAAAMRSLFPGALQKDAAGEVAARARRERRRHARAWSSRPAPSWSTDGFRFVNGGNAADFGVAESARAHPRRHRAERRQRGERVARRRWGCRPVRSSLGPRSDGRRRDRHPGQGLRAVSAGPTREKLGPVTVSPRARELAVAAAEAAADKLADDILAFDVGDQLVITDVFVLCSAPNDRQVKAIVDAVEERLRGLGAKPVRREGEREGRWVLLDYIDIIVHVQHAEERVYYSLERIWKDCPIVELPEEVRRGRTRQRRRGATTSAGAAS